MNFKLLLITLVSGILILPAYAQVAPGNPFSSNTPSNNGVKRCLTEELAHQEYNNNPAFRKSFKESINYTKNSSIQDRFSDGIVRVPVVVHVIHNNGPENISMGQIESQIRIFNEDFRKIAGTNGDGAGVDTHYEFFLAQKDELGNCTDGVVRIQSNLTVHSQADEVSLKALSQWNPTKYFNIWVVNSIAGGVLGYARLPTGLATDPHLDGIVVGDEFFGDEGTSGSGQYGFGRTATHEAGHWLGLLHPFQGGCGGNCATTGDFCCDTPPVDNPNFGCATGHVSCGDVDQVENYMDYSDDLCMNMFTADQTTRMDGFTANNRFIVEDSMNAINAGLYGCLGITYCQSEATNITGTAITNVTIESTNNSSANECSGYTDNTTIFADLTRDSTYSLSVTTAHCSGGTAPNHEVKAYIDWNRDGDFDDAGEDYVVKANGPSGTSSISITVPGTAQFDRTGMRIIATDGGVIGPCSTYPFGETEDYGLNIVAPPPSITAFNPTSGVIGTNVLIEGQNFTGTQEVKFNNTVATSFSVINNDTIQANVPLSATTGPITVTTLTGSDVSVGVFTVTIPPPVITNLNPSSGPIGQSLTIQGQNFANASAVEINGTPMTSFNIPFSTQITTTIPAGATTGKIVVTTPGGVDTSAQDFVITLPMPTATITGSGVICEGNTVDITFNLTGTPPFDVTYTDGTNNFTLNGITANHVETITPPVGNLTYLITEITDANFTIIAPNSSITGSANFTIHPTPVSAELDGGGVTICTGDSVELVFRVVSGSSPFDINIDNGIGQLNNVPRNSSIWVSPTSNTTYSITSLNDNFGCTTSNFSSSGAITANPRPNALFTKQSSLSNSTVVYTDQSTGATSWLWEFGDGETSTQQSPTHIFDSIGTFTTKLTASNASNCEDYHSETVLILNLTGLDLLSTTENLNLYPNPASDELNLDLVLDKALSVEINLMSTDGKVILNLVSEKDSKVHNMNMNLESLSKGMYLIQFQLSDGRTINSKIYKN